MAVAHSTAGAIVSRFKTERNLNGLKNGVNRTYTTPEVFLPDTIEVYHNGRRMSRSGSLAEIEYEVSESGGVGTGYDTVLIVAFSPAPSSVLRASYVKV